MAKIKLEKYKPNWQRLFLELLVVFLGVSGGFVLNNKRENYKDKKMEHNYIHSFIRNIDTNIIYLKEVIERDTIWQTIEEKRIDLVQKNKFPNDSIHLILNSIASASQAQLITSTYEDMKSSGNLNIIHDFNIKEKIISYHSSIKGVKYVDSYYNSFFRDFSMPFLVHNYSLVNDQFIGNKASLKQQLYNIFIGNYSMRSQRTEAFVGLLEVSEELKKTLQKYCDEEFK